MKSPARMEARIGALCLGIAGLSLLVPAAPDYDAWSWLIWGREIGHLDLSTVEGPAWKPLPTVFTALVAPTGAAAPDLWLLIARAGAVLGVIEAARLAARFSGGSRMAAALAATGVLLSGGYLAHAGTGGSEGLLLGLTLLALGRALDGRHGQALALGVAAALVRTETWPFLLAYGIFLWQREPALRRPLALAAAAVPALWFLPELWGSGDLLRSSERARIPNPGAPALADRPALESLRRAAGLPLLPLIGGVALAALLVRRHRLPRVAMVPAAAGLAWIGLVALMSEAGFSGEERYHLPGAAALAVTGAVGLSHRDARLLPRPASAAVALAVLIATAVRVADVPAEAERLARADRMAGDLALAVDAAGGPAALRACGPVHTGRFRGPIVAWHLEMHKAAVGFEPAVPGVVLRSRLQPGAAVTPELPAGFSDGHRIGEWEIAGACEVTSAASPRRVPR